MPGPVPKRDGQRRRRNKPDVETATGASRAAEPPPVDRSWNKLARDWYLSLADSGQSDFFEASDWMHAVVLAEVLSEMAEQGFPASQFAAWDKSTVRLLVAEGDRRRAHIELVKAQAESGEPRSVTALDEYRNSLSG